MPPTGRFWPSADRDGEIIRNTRKLIRDSVELLARSRRFVAPPYGSAPRVDAGPEPSDGSDGVPREPRGEPGIG